MITTKYHQQHNYQNQPHLATLPAQPPSQQYKTKARLLLLPILARNTSHICNIHVDTLKLAAAWLVVVVVRMGILFGELEAIDSSRLGT